MKLDYRTYGNSGISVSSLSLGAMQLGHPDIDEKQAEQVLFSALDSGINLIDTAPGYHLSEQRIGKLIAHRRHEFILSTKLGYAVPGVPDWTGDCITQGIDLALRTLQCEHLDIAHLHSCPRTTLEHSDVIDALERAKHAGKVRAIAYSGDNDALNYAISINRFDGFMASLNLFDQRIIDETLPKISGKGLLVKRPTANHPWRFENVPTGDYCEVYWHRWQAMHPNSHGLSWGEFALRFALSFDKVSSAVIGTSSVKHLQESIAWANNGSLPSDWIAELRNSFRYHDKHWVAQI
jgi:aryl-alcohol dehydrogenase-like predicted oxidoreductase